MDFVGALLSTVKESVDEGRFHSSNTAERKVQERGQEFLEGMCGTETAVSFKNNFGLKLIAPEDTSYLMSD